MFKFNLLSAYNAYYRYFKEDIIKIDLLNCNFKAEN